MTQETKRGVTPKLRFPEFQDAPGWEETPLHDICYRVVDKVGDALLTPVSITAGYGFVSQESKFGRNISGAQYKNYIYLRHGDFAYNRGNSKRYPQGYVCQLKEFDQAAASTAFLCFRLKNEYEAGFIQGLFDINTHGKQLAKHITSSARSDGLLNINPEDFFNIILPVPSHNEQQKIADCLASLEELIAAHRQKLDALKAHKTGLLQQLFPAEGETLPRLRFSEFQDDWQEKNLSNCIDLISGLHLSPDEYSSSGKVPYFTGPSDFTNSNSDIKKWTEGSSNNANANDVLITVKGAGVGELWYLTLPRVAMGRQLMAVRAKDCSSQFIYQFLATKKKRFEALGSGNLIPGLSRNDILDMSIGIPSPKEQQRIADCLTSIDEKIAAQSQKLDALKDHKKGLLQQLFPVPDEV